MFAARVRPAVAAFRRWFSTLITAMHGRGIVTGDNTIAVKQDVRRRSRDACTTRGQVYANTFVVLVV